MSHLVSLPPFLQPSGLSHHNKNVVYHHSTYQHRNSLGRAHTIWWPCCVDAQATPKSILLFIPEPLIHASEPGNPGLLGFYIPFLSAIWEESGSSTLAILAHSHVDHTPGFEPIEERRGTLKIGLVAQLENIIEVLESIRTTYGAGTKVLLVGHSVGSWLALQALKARPNDVFGVFLLFPTICNIASTPNGRRLSWLFRPPFPRLVSHASIIVRHLPYRILSLLFSSWPQDQIHVLQTLLRSPSAIWAALTMAHDEMITINEPDVVSLKEHHERLCFYFAEEDAWVGEQRDVVLKALLDTPSEVKVVHGHRDIPHAFCINHGAELASQCLDWMRSGTFL